ncbi:hypothetical protein RIR_jg5639.t1 [Rhizophagus irregularis DAOM 181602=DAOM 197198]|nr:hypothetical protein RIR_jg5639.t1 [Rhizophagus irregularis DAOM 181602=DAOM 197198]
MSPGPGPCLHRFDSYIYFPFANLNDKSHDSHLYKLYTFFCQDFKNSKDKPNIGWKFRRKQKCLDQILPNIIMHNVQDKISPESTQRLSYRSYRNSTSSTYSGPNSSKYYYAQMCKIRFLLSPRNVCRIAATVTQLLQLNARKKGSNHNQQIPDESRSHNSEVIYKFPDDAHYYKLSIISQSHNPEVPEKLITCLSFSGYTSKSCITS